MKPSGEGSDDDPTVDESKQKQNETQKELVPVDLQKMIEESRLKV